MFSVHIILSLLNILLRYIIYKFHWYRKDSNTLNFTDWNSLGPKYYKINLIKTMIYRLTRICSDQKI
jgi:hypothetical protein